MTPQLSTYDAALAALLAQKVQLEDNLFKLQAACTSDAQRQNIAASYHTAVTQYENALNLKLIQNNAAVLQNIAAITAVQRQIQDAIDQANAIANILNKITTGIQIGTSILKLMAAA